MHVETEQLIYTDQHIVSSFVQLRGSVPLVWSQQQPHNERVFNYEPPIVLDRAVSVRAFDAHMKMLVERFGQPVVCLSLLKPKGAEGELAEAFEASAKQKNIPFVSFDLHAVCGTTNFEKLDSDLLESQLAPYLKRIGVHVSRPGGEVERHQAGTLRTNCKDCLDRTNLVQAWIGVWVLRNLQLSACGCDCSEDAAVLALRDLWAATGDALSHWYCGTPSLRSEITRSGARALSWWGQLRDATTSAARFFEQNFADPEKMWALESLSRRSSAPALRPQSTLVRMANAVRPSSMNSPILFVWGMLWMMTLFFWIRMFDIVAKCARRR
jgi:hypothetical protein